MKVAIARIAVAGLAGCAAAPPATLPPAAPSPADTPYELYFLGGQSNMDGTAFAEAVHALAKDCGAP